MARLLKGTISQAEHAARWTDAHPGTTDAGSARLFGVNRSALSAWRKREAQRLAREAWQLRATAALNGEVMP